MDALNWLKKYNILYRDNTDLIIDEDNLSWMGGKDEMELDTIVDMPYNNIPVVSFENDTTVSKTQTTCDETLSTDVSLDKSKKDCVFEYSGVTSEQTNVIHGNFDKLVVDTLKNTVKKTGNKIPSMDFPQLKESPINEYEGIKIFAGSFPWLFPGGVGDVYCEKNR